jgi:phage terminase small subunit
MHNDLRKVDQLVGSLDGVDGAEKSWKFREFGNSAAMATGSNKLPRINFRQQKFITAYLQHGDAARAAVDAGFAVGTGYNLLKAPHIKQIIEGAHQTASQPVFEAYGVEAQRVLSQIAYGAFFDPARLFREDGSPKPLHEMDYPTRSQITAIDVQEKWEGSGQERRFVGNLVRFKLADRRGYLDMLMRHVGGYAEDNAQVGKGVVGAVGDLLSQIKGSTLPVVPLAQTRALEMVEEVNAANPLKPRPPYIPTGRPVGRPRKEGSTSKPRGPTGRPIGRPRKDGSPPQPRKAT